MWGIWDETEKCWLGTPDGPFVFQHEDLARIGQTVMWYRMKGQNKLEARLLPAEAMTKRDEFEPPLDFEKAWALATEGSEDP